MDAGKLFSQLMNRGESASGGILTGTAVSDSVDGSVMVQMDGSVVAQPSEDETELVVSAEEFADGTYVLPSVPYAGTLTVSDANGNELEQEDYDLDGSTLTIHALSSAPVDVSYETNVQQVLTNSDFDGDSYSLPSTTNLTVREDGQPVTYTLDGNLLTIDGIEHVTGIVEFAYTYDVSVVGSAGVNVLPNAPDEVAVFGRNSSGVDVVVTDYVLSGSTITLPGTYDAYTVDYPVSMVERWNVSDQYQQIPLEDSDDAADPETVTIGHNLQWEPSSVTSCTVDGVSTTYTLDVSNVVVDAPTITERYITLTYDLPVRMQVPASSFAVGPFTLPSVPVGSVITTMGGTVLANTVDDTQLTIDSLLTDSPTYTLSYTEQVEQDVVELPCTPYVAEGQFVEIAVVNGMPTVIGASGSGDAVAAAADAAEAAATAAEAVANAVNQHFWAADDGIHVTEVTEEEWNDQSGASYHSGANVLISSIGQLFRTGLNNLLGFVTSPVTGVAIFDGLGNAAANVVGLFTAAGLILGRSTESHAEVDYHSLRLVDKEGDTYLHISDLRDSTGTVTLTETFSAELGDSEFEVALTIDELVSAEVNGVVDEQATGIGHTVTLWNPCQQGDVVTITYISTDADAKAYTLGTRGTGNIGAMSTAIGRDVDASGPISLAEGYQTAAAGYASHAEGTLSHTFAHSTHAEGYGTYASGAAAHSEGWEAKAFGTYSHAEGNRTLAEGEGAHAEGYQTQAMGGYAHAEGDGTTAGNRSHAEGADSSAMGNFAHAQNRGTKASSASQTALGRYNVEDANDTYALIIGNGASNARSNALTVDWSGNVSAAGDVSATDVTASGTVSADSATLANPLPKASGGTGHTRGLHWQGQGSTSGTGTVTVDLANWDEVCIVATASGKLVTAVVPTNVLTSSTQELWLGGGKSSGGTANSGNLRAVCNISLTTVKGVDFSNGSTNITSSARWRVYAR